METAVMGAGDCCEGVLYISYAPPNKSDKLLPRRVGGSCYCQAPLP